MKPHSFTWKLGSGHMACAKCGLVHFRNAATQRRVRAGCKGTE